MGVSVGGVVLEASVDGHYHVVQRTSPHEAATLGHKDTCIWLLDIAGFTPMGKQYY